MKRKNLDPKTDTSFGDEWLRFDRAVLADEEAQKISGKYFAVFACKSLPPTAEGFDMGCGRGGWTRWVAPLKGLSQRVHGIPLSHHRKHTFYTMRTDARDRFGTPFEWRFTRAAIKKTMDEAGLDEITLFEGGAILVRGQTQKIKRLCAL